MISFAQNSEDVLIARFFAGEPAQFYVDIGAAHPIYHSVTRHFYELGWRGINLEARQPLVDLLQLDRPDDRTLRICVSDQIGEQTFYEVHVAECREVDNGGLSTLDSGLAADYRERGFSVEEYTCPVTTLNHVLEREQVKEIGFLKVDVEGHEPAVIRGLDLNRWRPRLIILECTQPLTSTIANTEATDQILAHRYQLAFFDGLNQFLVREEDEDKLPRLATPANALDGFVPFAQVELLNELAEVKAKLAVLQHDRSQHPATAVRDAICSTA